MTGGDRWLAAVLVVATLLLALLIPPMEVGDENAHFGKAMQLAFWSYPTERAGEEFVAVAPLPLARLAEEWAPNMQWEAFRKRLSGEVWGDLVAPAEGGDEAGRIKLANLASYPPVLYLPQAAGLRLAHAAGLPPIVQFYAGRLAAGAVSVALILFGASCLGFGGRTLLAVAVLPGVVQQLGSFSADSLLFGLAFATIGVLAGGGRRPASWALPVLLPLLVLAKGVYLPLAFSGLGERSGWQWRRLAWTALWVLCGLGVFFVWFGVLAKQDINLQHYVNRRTLQHVVAAAPGDQLAFMVAHPVAAAGAVFGTIVERLPAYVLGCLGRFGWLTVLMPAPLYALALFVLVCGAAEVRADAVLPTGWQRLVWAGIGLGVVVVVHVALYLTATAYGETFVEGVQGRYFLPALPLLALAIRFRVSGAFGRALFASLPAASALLAAGAVATVLRGFWQV